MSIQSEIERINSNVKNTISTIADTGVAVASDAGSDDLPALAAALANEKADVDHTHSEYATKQELEDVSASAGKGIESVEQTTISEADSGDNIITVTLTDGTQSVFTVKNGSKGSAGEKGDKGDTGEKGDAGADGFSPAVSVSKTGKTTRITIVDSQGTQVAEIEDGEDGAGAQSDWEENDETSANYVNNRTHWLEKHGEDAVVFAETNVEFSTGSEMVNGFVEGGFVEGWQYRVNWDGTEYGCECYLADGFLTIGNGALAGGAETKDYPFCISSLGGTTCFIYKDTDTAQTIPLQVESVAVKTYHRLDRNYLPDDIGSGADWEENDETASSYIKNRTHWIETVKSVLFEETAVECVEGEGAIFSPIGLAVGETYIVSWNGTEYECIAEDTSAIFGFSCVSIGDIKLMTTEGAESTGEPFVVAEVFDKAVAAEFGCNAMVAAIDGSTAPVISISGYQKIYVPFECGFLPESVPYIKRKITEIYNDTLTLSGTQTTIEGVTIGLAAGETYIVTWNGTEYECVSETYDGMPYIGNFGILTETNGTGEPFFIMTMEEQTGVAASDGSTTAEIKIVHVEKNYRPIDKDCIPPSVIAPIIAGMAGTEIAGKIVKNDANNYGEIFNDYSNNKATADCSHAEGGRTQATSLFAHAEGYTTIAGGQGSHAEGVWTTTKGAYSHAEGCGTIANSEYQHVQGIANIEDNENKYAHIVGNGVYNTAEVSRSNAHTLDWDGNAWYAGTVEGTALIVASSTEGSTKRFKITVDDSGTLAATEVTE